LWTADIDVGGTLTDGVFTNGDGVVCVKVDTTPHDLTVCLFDCLTQAADKVGFAGVAEFLDHIELIRWSTTITSNVLAELSGPRVGLLVSHGHEKDLYGREPSGVVLNRILAEKDVIGLGRNADETDIMNAARTLLESGVRRICVSLAGSHRHPEREISVKRTIDQQYPDHFLGSVPVLAGSDISQVADDQTRTHCALINAYTHSALASTLFKAEDELREKARYSGAFLVSHINGGVAGIAKTRAIDTIESGPILGIHASAFMAQAYGLRDVIAMDVGGTTAKIGVLKNGAPVNRKPSDFFGIPVDIPLPDLHSIPLGGGSVIRLRANGHHPAIQLGPESMGSYPGPACYDLGGDRPTLTDAFVAAGLINPDYFLGGTKPLNRDLATQAIEESIGKPLGVSTMDACGTVIGRAFEMVANVISNARAGHDFAADALLAYGGNGGLFACGVAEKAGLNRVHVFSLGPVFSAFGSSVSDISHVYERSLPGLSITDTAAGRIRQVVEEMKAESTKDLLGEGVRPEEAVFEIELDVSANELSSFSVPCPESAISGGTELHEWLSSACGLSVEPGNTAAELVRLKAKKSVTKPALVEHPLQEPDSSKAHIGPREVFWGSGAGEAQIYKWESLRPGNRVIGSALVEGANTTYFIPQGWVMNVDAFGNGTLHRK
jgi:N-methylhydantoinase A/oxoprolinase/acetone carboxylase beta subunit